MGYKCKDKRCKTCPAVKSVGSFSSETHTYICKAANCIYMIRCGVWDIRYIGQTSLALNLRINNHRKLCNSDTLNNNEYIQSKFEFEHFKIHSFSKAIIDILAIVSDHNKRLELENKYIIEYKTAYPFGLNDRVNNTSVGSLKDSVCIYQNYFDNNSLSIPKTNRIRSKTRINKFIDIEVFIDEIDNHCFNKPNLIKYVKNKILGLKINKAKIILKYVKTYKFKYTHIRDLVIDLLKFKTNCQNIDVDPYKFDSFLVINFSHKYIDLLNIPQLLYNQNLIKAFPIKYTYPKVSFKYSRTLGSIVYNYSQFSKNIKAEDINEYPWHCYSSPFKDVTHNHIITGNLDILEDNATKAIFKYGSKFRMVPRFNVDIIKKEIKASIYDYIHKLSYKLNLPLGYFSEWKALLLDLIFNKISSTNNVFPTTVNINQFKNKLKILQDKFIIMPVDKAGNNFGFMWKRYYAQVLFSEIETSNTFELSSANLTTIRDTFCNTLKQYKIFPTTYNIPFMYVIPKFHKNPTKFRYITSSVNCITKESAILLNSILDKLVNKIDKESEFNWIIKNNYKVLESLKQCNDNPGFPGNFMVATFDFSTLYTTLPHDDLIRCIVSLYNKYYNNDIEIKFNNKKIIISKISFVNILKFCIRNSYITFNSKIYRQRVGIPMGANYSPNVANLYLHFYESKFMTINHAEGRLRYKYMYRFIDDLFTINNRDILFDVRSIYPSELQITNTNSQPHKECSFLDIDIKIINGRFVSKIYDKRRDFNFDILGLPSFISNIPNKMTYGVLCSQFCRFASVCHFKEDFIFNCKLFITKLQQNGFPLDILIKLINKFEYKKRLTLLKFKLTDKLFTYITN